MIIAEPKPLAELQRLVAPYRRLLVVVCAQCGQIGGVTGGPEMKNLMAGLRQGGFAGDVTEVIAEMPCAGGRARERKMARQLESAIKNSDALLSLTCSLGAQALARKFADRPVLTGVNMRAKGSEPAPPDWLERCLACGDCRVGNLGGICPLTACTKGSINGPCGGAIGERCEADPVNIPCAWSLIMRRLEAQGRLTELDAIVPARDWFTVHSGGPKPLIWEEMEE